MARATTRMRSATSAPRWWGRLFAPRRERRRGFSLTREGRVFVLVTVGVGIAAVNTGNNLLYLVLGLLLSMLLTSGVLSDLVLHGIRVKRMPSPRLFAGTPSYFEIEVTNTKSAFASLSFEVLDVARDETDPPAGYVLKVPPRKSTRVLVPRTPTRRGALGLAEIRVRTRYPFGIVEKTRRFVEEANVVVYPQLVDASLVALDVTTPGLDDPSSRRGHGIEVIGLREYREGDPARDIHWRKSASRARAIARERARENDPEVVVDLATRGVDASEETRARFETDVSRAASIAVRVTERGRVVVVRTEDGQLASARGPAELDGVLTALAFVALEPARDDAR